MAHIIATKLSLVFILISFIILKATHSCHFTKEYKISIVDTIHLPELTFHCTFSETDLGNHTIRPLTNWNWTFCENRISNTVLYCIFWWGSKHQVFQVYNSKWGKRECGSGLCRWIAKFDGFYLSDGKYTPVKKYDWLT
ncbi:hypothetical protein ABFS82_03G050100 [Erythranthe guttata]